MDKYKQYNTEESSELIAGVLKNAYRRPWGLHQEPDWNMVKEEWGEWTDDIFNRGVLVGLAIAKKAWGKGLGLGEIRENEIYYRELLSSGCYPEDIPEHIKESVTNFVFDPMSLVRENADRMSTPHDCGSKS